MKKEEILCIFKPHFLEESNYSYIVKAIKLDFFENIVNLKELGVLTLTKEVAYELYSNLQDKTIFDSLVKFITSGKCFGFVLKGNFLFNKYKELSIAHSLKNQTLFNNEQIISDINFFKLKSFKSEIGKILEVKKTDLILDLLKEVK